MADFPTDLSSVTDNVDDVLAKHINNIETKIGVDASAVTTSLDYKVRYSPNPHKAKYYLSAIQSNIPTGSFVKINFSTQIYDPNSDFDVTTLVSGTADGTTGSHLIDSATNFITEGVVVGDRVKNTTDTTYAYVTAVADGDLTLDADIFIDTEGYEIKNSKFVAPVTGWYDVRLKVQLFNVIADKRYDLHIRVEGSDFSGLSGANSAYAGYLGILDSDLVYATAGQRIEGFIRSGAGVDTVDIANSQIATSITVALHSV